MKKRETYPGKAYAVTTQSGCSVYADEAGAQLIKTIEAGQGYFVAIGSQTWFDDDTAIITETFNVAPMAASGGGGVSVTVDQAFSSTSENAQSGKAVAGAFSTYRIKNQGAAVCIGQNSSVAGYGRNAISIGSYANCANMSDPLAIGYSAHCGGHAGVAIGSNASATMDYSVAIGSRTKNKDISTAVIGAYYNADSTITQLYLISAGSPLATKYESGAACLGYVVKEASGNIIECGTRKLSELLTSNTAFAPAAFGLDDEPTPGPFLPTGIMEPIEIDDLTESEQ